MSYTNIEWTDQTINPIIGCSKVSPACDNCYAERLAARLNRMCKPGYDQVVCGNTWTGRTHFNPDVLDQPYTQRKAARYFVVSMGDIAHESVLPDWIQQIHRCARDNQQHTFMWLTKRPENLLRLMIAAGALRHGPLPNLWIGVTAEDQARATVRIPALLRIPATIRFVSQEPCLGPINFVPYVRSNPGIDWVIVGGESGFHTRPMHPSWVFYTKDVCAKLGVPFFFKSWGDYVPGSDNARRPHRHVVVLRNGEVYPWTRDAVNQAYGNRPDEWARLGPTIMRRVRKNPEKRYLFGELYHQYPDVNRKKEE